MRIHAAHAGRAAAEDPLSTLQEKDGDLFAFANRNHSSNSARAGKRIFCNSSSDLEQVVSRHLILELAGQSIGTMQTGIYMPLNEHKGV